MPPKVHIVGLAGSGKTTLAGWIGEQFGVVVRDLDFVAYDPHGRERNSDELAVLIEEIRAGSGWVTEGAYHSHWLIPLLEDADTIAWLDVALHKAITRIVKRHVRAELSRNNMHPGWRKLWRFVNYSRKTGSLQRTETEELLLAYRTKVVRCRTSRDVEQFKRTLFALPAMPS